MYFREQNVVSAIFSKSKSDNLFCTLSLTVTSVTVFGGVTLLNFSFHEDERGRLYFSECNRKVSLSDRLF